MAIPHDHHRDMTEAEIGPDGVEFLEDNIFSAQHGQRATMVIVVSGPDAEDEITLVTAGECYLSREAATKLVAELTRRLQT